MKRKLTKIMAVLTVVGWVAAGPVAYAENDGSRPQGGKGYKHGGKQGFFKELNLTPEQKDKLKAQYELKKEDSKAAREQLKAKMRTLHQEISKPDTARADVNGLVSEVNELKGQMFSRKIDGLFAMKEILTPEQFAKMQAKHQERMDQSLCRLKDGWGKKNSGKDSE